MTLILSEHVFVWVLEVFLLKTKALLYLLRLAAVVWETWNKKKRKR